MSANVYHFKQTSGTIRENSREKFFVYVDKVDSLKIFTDMQSRCIHFVSAIIVFILEASISFLLYIHQQFFQQVLQISFDSMKVTNLFSKSNDYNMQLPVNIAHSDTA